MKINNKGISLVSLTIYVIVATVIIAILVFMNANFFSRISELTDKTIITNEYTKFISVFLKDLKNSNTVFEYDTNKIKFSNNVTYEIKVIRGEEETENKYAIYRDSVKICEGIGKNSTGQKPSFEYDALNNTVTISIIFSNDSFEWPENGTYLVGRGY